MLGLAGIASVTAVSPRKIIKENLAVFLVLVAFVAWAALAAGWSPHHGPTAAKVAAVVVTGLLFTSAAGADRHAARLTLAAALAAFVVLAILLGTEAAFDMPLSRAIQPTATVFEINRRPAHGLVVMLALVWPSLAWLLANHRSQTGTLAGVMLTVVAGALSLQFDQLSTAFGFAAGVLGFGFAWAAPRFAIRSLSLGLGGWVIAAPFLTPVLVSSPRLVELVPLSWAARIGIWRYTCARIAEQPWIGHGLDAGRTVTDRIEIRGLNMPGVDVHPHSASLQIWFDLGSVGAVLAATFIALGGLKMAQAHATNRPAAAAAAGTIAMFGLMANVGWSLWQEWWLTTLLIGAALVAALAARTRC